LYNKTTSMWMAGARMCREFSLVKGYEKGTDKLTWIFTVQGVCASCTWNFICSIFKSWYL